MRGFAFVETKLFFWEPITDTQNIAVVNVPQLTKRQKEKEKKRTKNYLV